MRQQTQQAAAVAETALPRPDDLQDASLEAAPPPPPAGWILALYPFAFVAGFLVSNSYWFLPAGLRFACLLLLPRSRWWALGVLEVGTILWLESGASAGYQTVLGGVLGMIAPWLIYALAVGLWRRRCSTGLPRTPQALALLLSAAMAAAGLVALLLVVMRLVEGSTSASELPSLVFNYMIGDFIGVLCVAPLLLQIGSPQAAWRNRRIVRDCLLTLLPLALVLWAVATWQSEATPFVALFAMIPPVWLAHRAGWRGAALAIAGSSAVVYFTSAGAIPATSSSLLQMFLALVGAVAIMLGGWAALEQRLRDRLELSNAELAEANQALSEQSGELRQLGARLVSAQEDERRRLRADLRGELSQQISALSGQLAMLVRQIDRPEQLAMVDTLRTHVQAIRDAAEECVERLQPQALSRMALQESLGGGALRSCLEAGGIDYAVQVRGLESGLPDDDRVTLYRVVQHLVAATLRCSDAVALTINVVLPAPQDARWAEVSAVLACRAPLVVGALDGEADIRALRDRMLAVGGRLDITPLSEHSLSCIALFPVRAIPA